MKSGRLPAAIFVMVLSVGWILPHAATGQSPSLEGNWEGLVLDPRRPYFLTAEFHKNGDGWAGTMSVIGNSDLPIQDLALSGKKVEFKIQLRQGAPAFQGELQGDEIVGKVTFRSGPTDFRLSRLPALPAPKDRVQAWRQDLDVALRFTRYDRSFTAAAKEEYRKRLEGLKSRVASLSDQQMFVELARAVALGNNGHTLVVAAEASLRRPMLPLRVAWFADGLFVVRAAPAYAEAVGCRVTGVSGQAVDAVQKKLETLFAGNDSWKLARSVSSFVSPHILNGTGVAADMDHVTYNLVCPSGKRDLLVSSGDNSSERDWISALPAGAPRPLYLRHRERNYWFEYLPAPQVLYFQFNSSLNGGEEPMPQFGERLLKELEEKPVKAMVVDMRFNGGGNLDIGENFIERLASAPKLQENNRLFVITGVNTFSAAIFHASQLRGNPNAVFVGEPVGDRLEFWAEGDAHRLPNSGLILRSSNGYHSYSKLDPPEFKPYFRDLSIETLAPDIPVRAGFKSYAEGRDVAMEAILSRIQ